MKVTVDPDMCEGNAVCVGLVPSVFKLGDEDVVQVLVTDVPSEVEDRVRKAVDRCPRAALALSE